jgi:hypothetical protein
MVKSLKNTEVFMSDATVQNSSKYFYLDFDQCNKTITIASRKDKKQSSIEFLSQLHQKITSGAVIIVV